MAYTFKHGDRLLDDYTIQRAVGRGGFGEVYYAVSDGGREVALKYLRENPQVELRGVSHCINLKSPYLVSIFDVKKTADGEYVIIMEYCSGPSLRDLLIAEPNGFGAEKAAFFTREIGKGLAYLHDRGIVHRDLKPGNIFFDDGYVKIGDYGLSKFIAVSRHSAQTASVGTVHYMAPEIGSGNYSRGVDIYALGVMLYEMLMGKLPFEGSSMAEILMKHLTAQPELDDLPQPFGNVIRRALEKDPKDRYQTVDEMVEDLLAGEEIQKSLAGFSPQSLSGAVRYGGRDVADSPRPSPNPPPPPPLGMPVRPFAPGSGGPLPEKLAKRFDRVSRRIDKKVARLGGYAPPGPSPEDVAREKGQIPWAMPAPPKSLHRKRFLLLALLTAGISVVFGVVVANATNNEDFGVGAGFLVVLMLASVSFGRRATDWFAVRQDPAWADRLVRAVCAAPLLAAGCAPFLDRGVGMGMWLGLIVAATFVNWEKTREIASEKGISPGRIIVAALTALVATAAITGGAFDRQPEEVMFIAAGVAGLAALLVQAGASWVPPGSGGSLRRNAAATDTDTVQAEHFPEESTQMQSLYASAAASNSDESSGTITDAVEDAGRVARWTVTRMFWSVVAFILMGGGILTTLIAALSRGMNYHDMTATVVGATACAAAMLFALRKTTPFKRPGFWRETLRPALISLAVFGIGGTTTGVAREMNHYPLPCDETRSIVIRSSHDGESVFEARIAARASAESLRGHFDGMDAPGFVDLEQLDLLVENATALTGRFGGRPCLRDPERALLISGLVISSLAFIILQFFTGGKPRQTQPFLRA